MSDRISILSTRMLPDLDWDANEVRIDEIPFINIQPIDSKELREASGLLNEKSITAIFTSRHGIEAVKPYTSGANWTFACMGGATRKLAEDYFGEEKVVISGNDSEEIAAKISRQREQLNGLVFFCSDRRLDHLPELLKKENIAFTEMIVYRTVLTPHALQKHYDAIMFFSPSAAESFFSIIKPAANTVMFTIGETTAKAVRTYCNNEVVVSPQHSAAQLLATVKMYYKNE